MTPIFKFYKWIFPLVLIVAIGLGGYIWYSNVNAPAADKVKMRDAKIIDLKQMAQLCTLEFVEDLPIKANIGNKHIFARSTVTGSISFDLDGVVPEWSGDTIKVVLPKETIEIYESADKDSYEVIDTWNDSLFGSARFSADEENAIKRKVMALYRDRLYKRGYIRKAREEARANLEAMIGAVSGAKVIVSDQ